jgi:threonine dehydrogenase-like Zn-dependent dehydrogenase
MKAIVVERPNVLKTIEIDPPQLNTQNNVLIKMRAVGICGSDVHIYHGTNAAAVYPRIMGHEIVGVVERTGEGVHSLKKGDRVTVSQMVSCGKCYACRHGRSNVCSKLKVRGVHFDGGFQEYIAVPEKDCYLLPAGLSDEDSVMIEPVTVAIQNCERAGISADDTLLILGYGALGSIIFKVARWKTSHIIAADIAPERLKEAEMAGIYATIDLSKEDLGASCRKYTDGYGPTVTMDTACTRDSLMQAITVTGNAGRVIVMGFATTPCMVNQFLITSKELDLRGSRLQNGMFPEAIRLVQEGKLELQDSVSHRFKFTEAQSAFDFIDSHNPSIRKIALTF